MIHNAEDAATVTSFPGPGPRASGLGTQGIEGSGTESPHEATSPAALSLLLLVLVLLVLLVVLPGFHYYWLRFL